MPADALTQEKAPPADGPARRLVATHGNVLTNRDVREGAMLNYPGCPPWWNVPFTNALGRQISRASRRSARIATSFRVKKSE
jgi:hypothetical protein